MKSIQNKLFVLFVLVTLGVLVPTLLTVRHSLSQSWQGNISKELTQKSNLISILLKSEGISLLKLATLVAEEPTLKMSMQLNDPATIQDTLTQLQSMLTADLILVTDSTGKLLAKIDDNSAELSSDFDSSKLPLVQSCLDEDEFGNDLILYQNNLFLVAGHSISFGENIGGTILVGKSLRNQFAKFLALESGGPVSLLINQKIIASSWTSIEFTPQNNLEIMNERWQGEIFDFDMQSIKLQLFLQSSLSSLEAKITELEKQLLQLGLLVLFFAMLLSYLFAKQLGGPIARLREAAGEVASGNFEQDVRIKSNDELGELGTSFNSMRKSLIDQREELIRTENIKKDLELASKIQESLLPRSLPVLNGIEIGCKLIPSNMVGGDYYGFLSENSKSNFGCVIADVAGHGTASAILMAMARSVIQAEAERTQNAAHLLQRVNHILYPDLEEAETFISMFCFNYDKQSSTLKFANAGHNLPILYRSRSDQFDALDADGMLIGILEDAEYELKEVKVNEGDFLLLYTDGLVEPHNAQREQFSLNRVQNILREQKDQKIDTLVTKLYEAVEQFAGDQAFSDDRTCVLIRWRN